MGPLIWCDIMPTSEILQRVDEMVAQSDNFLDRKGLFRERGSTTPEQFWLVKESRDLIKDLLKELEEAENELDRELDR